MSALFLKKEWRIVLNKKKILIVATVVTILLGGSSFDAVNRHNKVVAMHRIKVIKIQTEKLNNKLKEFSTTDLAKADQKITEIKNLKFVASVGEKRDVQIKQLTDSLNQAVVEKVEQVKLAKYDYNKINETTKVFNTLSETIKELKSLSDDQVKKLVKQINKNKTLVINDLNKQKSTAEKKAAGKINTLKIQQASNEQETAMQTQAAPVYQAPVKTPGTAPAYQVPAETPASTNQSPNRSTAPKPPTSNGESRVIFNGEFNGHPTNMVQNGDSFHLNVSE